jgi:hypothetical protein
VALRAIGLRSRGARRDQRRPCPGKDDPHHSRVARRPPGPGGQARSDESEGNPDYCGGRMTVEREAMVQALQVPRQGLRPARR